MTAPMDDKNFRLSEKVRPLRYVTKLTLKPNEKRFHGSMRIELNCEEPQTEVVLHAISLSLTNVRFTNHEGTFRAREVVEKPLSQTVVLVFEKSLPKGQ